MSLGLCNALKTVYRLKDNVIPADLKTHLFVYVNDLLIISGSFNWHLEVLRLVTRKIEESGLTIHILAVYVFQRFDT